MSINKQVMAQESLELMFDREIEEDVSGDEDHFEVNSESEDFR